MATAEPNTTPAPSCHTVEAIAPARSDGRWWPTLLASGVIVVAGLAAYANSFHGPFIFDDIPSISDNPSIIAPQSLAQVFSPPRHGTTVSSRPLLNLSLAINYALGGMETWGYHATNLTIHILNGLLLLGILRRTFALRAVKERLGAAGLGLALAIALLWLLHPLQTESVTYIVQRAESLGTLFCLLVLGCVVIGATSRHSRVWYVLAVLACAIGTGVKEIVATLPVVVLLYDRTFLGGPFGEAWRRRYGLYLGLMATWLLQGLLLVMLGGKGGAAGFGHGITPGEYALTQCVAISHYLRLTVWPSGFCFDYGTPIVKAWSEILPGATVVGTLVLATSWALVRRPALGFLGALFMIVIAPSSSLIPIVTQTMAEHRMYLPLAAVVTLVVVGGYVAGKRLVRRGWCSGRACLAAGICVVTSAAVVLGCLTFRRNESYRTELSIWQDTLSKARHTRSYFNVGVALQRLGRSTEAIDHYEQAIRLAPEDPRPHNNLGLALAKAGRFPEAVEHHQKATRLDPDNAEACNNLGLALAGAGRLPEAIENFQQAIRLKPSYVEAHNNLGNALANTGRLAEAIEQYQLAIQIDPEDAGGHNNLGVVLADVGRFAEAIEHLELAIRLNPNDPLAQNNLGRELSRAGRLPEAITHYQQAIRLNPDYAEAHYNLALALMKAGRVAEAIEHGKQAVKGMPSHLPAIRWVAWLMATHEPADPHDLDQAVELAERACTLTGRGDSACLDILAAAYAAAGQFDKAVVTAREAWQIARAAGQESLAEEIHVRLQLYRDRKPYREPVAVPTSRKL